MPNSYCLLRYLQQSFRSKSEDGQGQTVVRIVRVAAACLKRSFTGSKYAFESGSDCEALSRFKAVGMSGDGMRRGPATSAEQPMSYGSCGWRGGISLVSRRMREDANDGKRNANAEVSNGNGNGKQRRDAVASTNGNSS